VQKAIESLGLGARSLHKVPVNADYEIDVAALARQIAADSAAGLQPFCVIGNAATINTGATDDLAALADLCERERLWFHVDGAIGSLLALAPGHRHYVRGIERADSVTLDFHKWLHVPFEAACVLVRDRQAHREAFALTPEYLEKTERGLASGPYWFSEYGLQLSRGFRALKVWLTIKEHGLDRFGRLIDRNIAQARELAQLIADTPGLELLAPVRINIVCFRYHPGGELDTAALNALNQELLVRLHESGVAAPSYTTLGDRYCLRAAITNFRTTSEDLAVLVREVTAIGRTLTGR
jgi:glutamate/tyrosine decarboxylase-like PLP-dependent enzyme